MRDAKDHTTLELPGFSFEPDMAHVLVIPVKQIHQRRLTQPRSNKLSQLDLLAPLGETDRTGLPSWNHDAGLDLSGLPVWEKS
jgi:hypothetical protein